MSNLQILDCNELEEIVSVDETKADRLLNNAINRLNKKIIVLDDDPTGVQTVHGVSVYTDWTEETILSGFKEDSNMFFILTNSRSFSAERTSAVHEEIARNIVEVSQKTGRDFILISRGDSTMRGHYPLETQILRDEIEKRSDKKFYGEIFCPFFKEGGRFTLNNIHYVKENNALVPAGQTEFAKDKTFGYVNSHIGDFIEEKSKGQFKSAECIFISLEELRSLNVESISKKLMAAHDYCKVIVNAVDYVDIKVFCAAFIQAIEEGRHFIIRSAAAMPKVLGGVSDVPLLTKQDLVEPHTKNGGIVLIGSHVNKTTMQLEALKTSEKEICFIEFNAHLVLEEGGLEAEVTRIIESAEENIKKGKTTAIYTSRKLLMLNTEDKDKILETSVKISDAVTSIIGKMNIKPRFIIAKGGITSSDVGTKALRVKKAMVMGQIKPGIPVWMTGEESRFPNMPYIIFPGNVGEINTLKEIVEELS
ncbi:MAG: hypothetical protein K0S71_1929 [Clostridia bacterium]|jgi:uncharacterized protein YgbK (DUF1537 family)|nr:hypothetical protein [Clostridia bacterium]